MTGMMPGAQSSTGGSAIKFNRDSALAYTAALGGQNGHGGISDGFQNHRSQQPAGSDKRTIKCEFDLTHLYHKVLPKLIYFAFQFAFCIPLVWFNRTWLFYEQEGMIFCALFFISTTLTFATYLKVSLADPGFINSMMFNEAYANNETEVSQVNQTQQDQILTNNQLLQLANAAVVSAYNNPFPNQNPVQMMQAYGENQYPQFGIDTMKNQAILPNLMPLHNFQNHSPDAAQRADNSLVHHILNQSLSKFGGAGAGFSDKVVK